MPSVPQRELPSLAHLWCEEGAEARMQELDAKHPVHPLYFAIDGDGDSSDGDETPLTKGRGVQRARAGGRSAAQERSTTPRLRAPEPKSKTRRSPSTKTAPTRPEPAPAPAPVQPPVPTSPPAEDAEMQLEESVEPSPVPAKRPATVLELSSASEDEVESSPPPVRHARRSLVRAADATELRGKRRGAEGGATAKVGKEATARGRGVKKPRLSLEQAMKLRPDKLLEQFPTISAFVEHLAQLDPEPTDQPRLLAGCRVAFVNTSHWRSTRTAPVRNRFDQALRLNMRIVAKHGATLVKPKDFVPPPFDVDDAAFAGGAPSAELAARAEREGWTTHIIPLQLEGQRAPTYDEVLACLGPGEAGIARAELGPFVHVVHFRWVSEAVNARARPAEWDFALKGDFREAARREQEKEVEAAQALRKRRKEREREKRKATEADAAKRQRQGARGRKGELEEDTEDESDDDEEALGAVSPLNPDDWPDGELPRAGYFDLPPSQASVVSTLPKRDKDQDTGKLKRGEVVGGGPEDASDPIDEPDRTRSLAATCDFTSTSPKGSSSRSSRKRKAGATSTLKGLEEEFKIIDDHGVEAVDRLLEEPVQDLFVQDAHTVLSTRPPDDFATDNEDSEGECRKEEAFDPRKRVPRNYRYACDDPAANRGRRDGPNEAAARTIELLASLIPKVVDKDDFRIRSHKQAANKLRACPTKLERYDQLVQIRGIGDKLARKIVEIHRTGSHRRISTFETEADKSFKLFSGIYGVNSATAQVLYARGARSIADLRQDPDRYGFTKAASKIGLDYYEDLLERIPRTEMTELFGEIKKLARDIDPKLVIECMGSYRRGAESSGDIDLLVTRDPADGKTHKGMIKHLWNSMRRAGIAQYELSMPDGWEDLDAKINGLCKLPRKGAKMRRIDILGVPWDELPAALIYFTGNDFFNRSLRLKARRHGYRLNQRALYKDVARDKQGNKLTEGVRVPGIRNEEDIFRVLKVPWCRPEERIP